MLGPQNTLVNAGGQEVQELQRDDAMQPGVLGLVDHTHPATAQCCCLCSKPKNVSDLTRTCPGPTHAKSARGDGKITRR